jgi:hypothetical protein
VHLAAEEAQRTLIVVVGIIHLGEHPEGVAFDLKGGLPPALSQGERGADFRLFIVFVIVIASVQLSTTDY